MMIQKARSFVPFDHYFHLITTDCFLACCCYCCLLVVLLRFFVYFWEGFFCCLLLFYVVVGLFGGFLGGWILISCFVGGVFLS